MKIKDIISNSLSSQKDFVDNLKLQKKIDEYAKKNNVTDLYSLIHKRYSPVFVLSTGRSGTAFLTHLLKIEKSLQVFHEPDPVFSYHTALAYKNYKTKNGEVAAMFDAARYELIRNTFINEKIYVETNNRITFFAFQIAELFPNAKFIHLVRNPISFIKSGLARDWYSGNSIYDEGRIAEEVDSWKNKSQIEKIAWLWNETNSFIEEFKKSHSNVLTIKAEDLFISQDEQLKVFEYLGCRKPAISALQKLTAKKINEGKTINFSKQQVKKIEDIAASLPVSKLFNY